MKTIPLSCRNTVDDGVNTNVNVVVASQITLLLVSYFIHLFSGLDIKYTHVTMGDVIHIKKNVHKIESRKYIHIMSRSISILQLFLRYLCRWFIMFVVIIRIFLSTDSTFSCTNALPHLTSDG